KQGSGASRVGRGKAFGVEPGGTAGVAVPPTFRAIEPTQPLASPRRRDAKAAVCHVAGPSPLVRDVGRQRSRKAGDSPHARGDSRPMSRSPGVSPHANTCVQENTRKAGVWA